MKDRDAEEEREGSSAEVAASECAEVGGVTTNQWVRRVNIAHKVSKSWPEVEQKRGGSSRKDSK